MTNSKTHKDEIDYLIIVACTVDDIELRDEGFTNLRVLNSQKSK